jgi:aminoglycoside phosphotransferase (APT) family kinase protein
MALANTRDPQESATQLAGWLATKLDGATDVEVRDVETPQASGMSNETLLFTASWKDSDGAHEGQYVARVAPAGPGVFPNYDLVAEQRVMHALSQHTDAPTPAAPWVETDAAVLGAPFLVMERVAGRVASDDPPFTATGWVLDLTADERARLNDNALAALAEIHKADYLDLGLGFLDRPELGKTPLDQQIAEWEQTYAWAAEGEVNPTIPAGFEWIAANRPQGEEATVLNWGDARIGNMLVADDMTINAVLDWEMVTIGAPEQDLGWWLFLLRHHTEGIGMPLPEGFPSREETIARYAELTGNSVDNVDFYEAFSALKLSILMHRAGNMMIAGGMLPPDAPMKFSNPASQLLAKLIGAPAPTGTSQSFIGNR